MNINIFPEFDAGWYISDISEKHTSLEYHSYKSMAAFCISHHFQNHTINRHSTRREIFIKSKSSLKKEFADVLITPLKVLTVDITNDENSSKVQFVPNPPEQKVIKIEKLAVAQNYLSLFFS